jgi:hypothetical protein
MKKLLCIFLVGLLLGLSSLLTPALAQPSNDDLYYTFYGQRIPLVQRRDRIAVLLTPQPSGTRSSVSPYQQLQQALLGQPSGSRSLESAPALEVSVRPLGSRYAVIELPNLDAELVTAVEERLQQPYIEATVPVLSRANQDDTIRVLDPKHCKKLAEDLQTLSLMAGHLFNPQCEQLSTEQLLASPHPQKTRLSVINLGSLGDDASILFWVSQFLLNLNRYAQRHPSGQLQVVFLFDEADLYLPAQGKSSTKEPMESLLKQARSAGLGILLATQSPGDLDYRCRDQISSWFVGKVKENTAINKLKPILSEAKTDVTSKLANQQVGEFFAIRAGEVTRLKANLSLIRAEQVPLEMVQALAASSVNQ